MRRTTAYNLLILACIFVSIQCAHRTTWQGEYVAVTYTKYPPKEDFKAAGYIVVAYDVKSVDKYSGVIYRFEIMLGGKKKGALELCNRNTVEAYWEPDPKYEYYLLAGDSRLSGQSSDPFLSMDIRQAHKMYEDIPSYMVLKNDVIEVLWGE